MPRREKEISLEDALTPLLDAPATADPEAATAALEAAEIIRGGRGADFSEESRPPREKRQRTRLKVELEHENEQLRAEIAKRDAAVSSPEAVADLGIAIGESFGIVFGVVATMQGPHWALGKQEKDALGRVWAPCLAPLLAKYPQTVAWGLAVGSTVAIVGPRVAIDRKLTQLKKGEGTREPPDTKDIGDSGDSRSRGGDLGGTVEHPPE